MHDLENEFTDVLPGLSVPAGVADFVFARIGWISEGEIGDFDVEAPPPWNFNDLCTLSFFVMNRDGIAVPLILPSGSIGKLGNQLMWTPWRFLENVTGDQDDEETDVQRQNRLEVFPLSVFPAAVDSNDSGDSDMEES